MEPDTHAQELGIVGDRDVELVADRGHTHDKEWDEASVLHTEGWHEETQVHRTQKVDANAGRAARREAEGLAAPRLAIGGSLQCPGCGGRRSLIAFLDDQELDRTLQT